LYVILDLKDASFEKKEKHDEIVIAKVEQKSIKEIWGPILVDKRLDRKPQDGHTVMEKAQER
jgi:hypothetical protein